MATNFNVFPHFDDIQYLDILRTRRHDLSRTATVTNDIQIVYCKINTIKKKKKSRHIGHLLLFTK